MNPPTMNIVVCAKQVPDPNLEPKLDGTTIDRSGSNVLDEADEYGVEAALQLKEAHGGEVTVVTMGPAPALEALRKALSMGADKGIFVSDESLKGADALTTAKVLAAAIQRNGYDIVIAGVESADGYTGVVPQMLAEALGVPSASFAKTVNVDGSSLKFQRQTQAGYDDVECSLPAVLTVTAGANEPRYPNFKGIMAAKSKPVDTVALSDLSVDTSVNQSVANVADAPPRQAGEVIEDDGTAAAKIVDYLEKAKVI